ncbi:MAG: Tat pathway signal sequence domain protein, partial [Burkholderiales bacterium]|nr:Tat pathway signal sequence domain protein [Burkholderiales bacterium]
MTEVSRRSFFKAGLSGLAAPGVAATAAPAAAPASDAFAHLGLRWLDDSPPALALGQTHGQTLGLPWPRGRLRPEQRFALHDGAAQSLPLQTWPMAYWPDGSLKWTGHAIPAGLHVIKPTIQPVAADSPAPRAALTLQLREDAEAFTVDTGVLRCVVPRQGPLLMHSVLRNGREILRAVSLVAQADDRPDAGAGPVTQTAYTSALGQVTVEQSGPVRAVLRLQGMHRGDGNNARAWLPFTVRLYFYAGAESVRIMHSFVFDGDEQRDFLRGIGLRFEVPMRDALHDRHVRFGGEGPGLWAEGVRNLTGLRRDPGAAVRAAQLAGTPCPPLASFAPQVRQLMHRIPVWGDHTLSQQSPDAFEVRKRTQAGHGWIHAAWGRRAP